ncbi:ADP-ribosylglycohydrolase family protein [Algoriphagus sp. C2-6-M1]|uniref:ADP-ribosylglycohydrolase family protein n=1 Tax=Algoriphagus persicinus TaxID=3108754 RepID=UPI002B38F4BE|nr:ADP-ribosylglycohydrolase family protein [Algoriphagus sp. C2-6-M1]MEB2780203.1 ADP-ribosylglycohydrolase family protein [Algoriphagus sp. C2-6-M1]
MTDEQTYLAKKDAYQGSLLGGAVGDALGAPIEFYTIAQIRKNFGQSGLSDFVEFKEGKGRFTDDTQMTLFTAEGLLRARHRAMLRGIEGALHQITFYSYLRWLLTQTHSYAAVQSQMTEPTMLYSGWLLSQEELYSCRAPGNTCLQALRNGKMGSMENPINESKGCGTIMRMAPVGLMFGDNPILAFNEGCHLSALTHGHASGYLSGGFFAALIAFLIKGESIKSATWKCLEILTQVPNHDEVEDAVLNMFSVLKEVGSKDLEPEDLQKLGEAWIAEEALAISLLCAIRYENDFDKGVIAAVNHSGDSDSTGAIVGNILGLINGKGSIPEKWQSKLHGAAIVLEIAEDLAIGVKGNSFEQDKEWWNKYPGN